MTTMTKMTTAEATMTTTITKTTTVILMALQPRQLNEANTCFEMRLARVFEKALRTYGWTDRPTDRRMDGPTDGRTDGSKDWQTFL